MEAAVGAIPEAQQKELMQAIETMQVRDRYVVIAFCTIFILRKRGREGLATTCSTSSDNTFVSDGIDLIYSSESDQTFANMQFENV